MISHPPSDEPRREGLPELSDIQPFITEQQVDPIGHLLDVLANGETVLLDGWRERSTLGSELFSNHYQLASSAAAVVCDRRDLGVAQTHRAAGRFVSGTELDLYLEADNVGSTPIETSINHWYRKLDAEEPSIVVASELMPTFPFSAYILQKEIAHDAYERWFWGSVDEQELYEEINVLFIADDLSITTMLIDGIQSTYSMYQTLAAAGNKPLDPEQLTGIVDTVMEKLGFFTAP